MNRIISILICCLLLLAGAHNLTGQINPEAAAKKELERRGLTEQEVKDALMARGINIDNIDTSDPVQLAQYESEIRAVIEELEKKKKSSKRVGIDASVEPIVKVSVKDEEVVEAVEEGATVDEAINESIQQTNQELAPKNNIYGHSIFRDKTLKLFRTVEGAKVPPTYKIGDGDVVNVVIFERTVFTLNQVVEEGFIKPENRRRIYIGGMTLDQAKEIIYKELRRWMTFNRDEIIVTITTARTINVNIAGEVFNPGSYNISALNTGVNALVAAGGPSSIGSVRNIKIMSPGKTDVNLDIYEYLNNPKISETYYLEENDYVFVPVAQKVVTISGEVNRPMRYELKDNENLNKLIEFAGGLKPTALRRNIKIRRIQDDERIVIDVDYENSSAGNFVLKNGDEVIIDEINSPVDNIVSVSGAVENPGEFAYTSGLKISELLDKAGVKDDAILDIVYIRRLNPDKKTRRYEIVNIEEVLQNPASSSNIALEQGDQISILSTTSLVETYSVKVEGEVRSPGVFGLDKDDDFRLTDLILLAGGATDAASNFGYIYRKDPNNLEKPEFIYFNYEELKSNPSAENNVILLPNDKVTLFSKFTFLDETKIEIKGAVRNPKEIVYSEGVTLRDALLLAGGLKREASNSRVEIYRLVIEGDKQTRTLVATVGVDEGDNFESSSTFFLQPYDQIQVRYAAEFEFQQNVELTGEVAYPGEYALLKDNTRLSDIIRQAGGLTEEAFQGGATLIRSYDNAGFVVINLEGAVSNPGGKYDLILRKGDQLNIPKRNTLVSISGATNASKYYPDQQVAGKINVAFEGRKRANTYVNKFAGGFTDNSSRKSLVVEYANGQVKETKRFLFFNIYPRVEEGAHIKVSNKPVETKEEKEKKDIDWGNVLANSITQATAILSLVLLLRSLD